MKWHYAATAKAVIQKLIYKKLLTLDIDVFVFTNLALLKAVSFIDLNPLSACVAEKQQSDEKLTKIENKQILILRCQPR